MLSDQDYWNLHVLGVDATTASEYFGRIAKAPWDIKKIYKSHDQEKINLMNKELRQKLVDEDSGWNLDKGTWDREMDQDDYLLMRYHHHVIGCMAIMKDRFQESIKTIYERT